MKKALIFTLSLSLAAVGCGTAPQANNQSANTEAEAVKTPEAGPGQTAFYAAKGVVTKIADDKRSVEIDHEEVPGLMPKMKMEFPMKEKTPIKDIAVGDAVNFTFTAKDGKYEIIAIGK